MALFIFSIFLNTFLKCNIIFKNSPPEVFCRKDFLEISQNSQENNCARVSFLIKFQASGTPLCWVD